MSILDKHADKWHPEPNSGCYLWVGATLGQRDPRPAVRHEGKTVLVSRLVCEEAYGDMTGYQALHKPHCEVGLCVNDKHLYKGTHSDNERDKHRHKADTYGITATPNGFKVQLFHKYVGYSTTLEGAVVIREEWLNVNKNRTD